jgi:hypothetical protein
MRPDCEYPQFPFSAGFSARFARCLAIDEIVKRELRRWLIVREHAAD